MRYKFLKMNVMLILAFMLLVTVIGADVPPSASGLPLQTKGQTNQLQNAGHHLGSSDRMRTSVPDGILELEPKGVSFVRNGRQEEHLAESVVLFGMIFLIAAMYLSLLNGRPWSSIESAGRGYQGYSMHQLEVLQSWDGKKRRCSYFNFN